MEERPVNFVAMNDKVMLACNFNDILQSLAAENRTSRILRVAGLLFSHVEIHMYNIPDATHFNMMSFVLGLIMDLRSITSNCQPFSSDDFHKLTSAPRDSGTEYNC